MMRGISSARFSGRCLLGLFDTCETSQGNQCVNKPVGEIACWALLTQPSAEVSRHDERMSAADDGADVSN